MPAALRFALKWLLGAGMVAIAAVLISNLHLHFFIKPHPLPARPSPSRRGGPRSRGCRGPGVPFRSDPSSTGCSCSSSWRRWRSASVGGAAAPPGAPPLLPDAADADELREAVESGRLAFAELDDARAAIIACYLAMERSLAGRGAARGAANTPDELLARVISAGIVRGAAARRVTGLFYEARFSTHPLGRTSGTPRARRSTNWPPSSERALRWRRDRRTGRGRRREPVARHRT